MKMTILRRLFKCLCVCICIEKGSWSPKTQGNLQQPAQQKVTVNKHRVKTVKYKRKSDSLKPEWLKQWTISKGWTHDKTHMLSLGMKGDSSCNLVDENDHNSAEDLDNIEIVSSSSIDNASDLLSVINNIEENSSGPSKDSNLMKDNEITESSVTIKKVVKEEYDKIEVDQNPTDVFDQISVNYRNHFPLIHKSYVIESAKSSKVTSSKLFKKCFTKQKDKEAVKYSKIVFPNRQTLFKKSDESDMSLKQSIQTPVSKYKTFDDLTVISPENDSLSELASTNMYRKKFYKHQKYHNIEDTIYECSEDNCSLYNNPIYESQFQNGVEILESRNEILDFNRKTNCEYQQFLNNDLNTNKFANKEFIRSSPLKTIKTKFSSEKYIIRHIRIRIMLTLRLKKFQRLYRKRLRNTRQFYAMKEKKKKKNKVKCDTSDEVLRNEILKVHDEQRRIGNGKSSLKIQNLRYGRLNVLRWLLWESQSESQGEGQLPQGRGSRVHTFHDDLLKNPGDRMPALEREKTNPGTGNTLALHYAAARGCLDCVKLLVDSTTELSANTQMDNDVTPVYLAAQEGHLEVLKFLVLEAGGSLYVRAKDGMAPLHAASQMGCLNCVKWMIQEQGVDPNLRDGDGATPLHFAASRGHLETVRWLLRHGARLSLDKYGKSPINDAAENQQVECLNVLVQHGATPDYNDSDHSSKTSCSCSRKTDTQSRTSHGNDCTNCLKNGQEPFYLHPPSLTSQRSNNSIEAPHAPQDGLYINPMNNHRHSNSSSSGSCSGDSVTGESFYLHNPQEVIYNRVRDLFEATSNQTNQQKHQGLSALTVKVEVHSSSSGAGSDENLSSSDLSERSGDHDHDYEDIYLAREESKNGKNIRSRSRDSGSHSRSGSASSSNSGCNVIVKTTPKDKEKKDKDSKRGNEFLPKPQKYEKVKKDDKNSQESGLSSSPSDMCSEEENEKVKLQARHSLQPPKNQNNKQLKRVVSVPLDICPPPPPPPPPANLELTTKKDLEESVEVIEEPTVRPSDVVKGMVKSMSGINAAKRLNSSCSDLTIVSLNAEDDVDKAGPNLVNKQRVLPFIPPSFPGSGDSNCLIKPSEYLRSISDKRSSVSSSRCSDYEDPSVVLEEKKEEPSSKTSTLGPPPPPLPAFKDLTLRSEDLHSNNSQTNKDIKKQQQPLSAISIHDLNSVQLRRTDKMLASKTFSAPTRSLSLQCLQSENYISQKNDLISELKMSKDITGIKKLKVEQVKLQEKQEKELFTEITKQITASTFVEKIPDITGNIIPAWKRQMMAKKAAERARRELEEQLQREAEEKRLQAIPQWKRQLMAKKEETEIKIKSTIYTPKVEESRMVKTHEDDCWRQAQQDTLPGNNMDTCNKEDNKPEIVIEPAKEEETRKEDEQNIIPWRAQLRKTNSKLNLLD